ncbi:MAG: ankyrin repeat domain-containing protein, partial [Desulfovibrio sp.]|nr:ankyrin repeat domain-containing protein [Desulfovibrio sp.]
NLSTPNGRTVAHVAARHGHLPPDFDSWGIAKPSGWTVAHEAAEHGHLPPGFSRWELADCDGWTVAHAAAFKGGLPPDFDQWELIAENGVSVAHRAALAGALPNNFSKWDICDDKGQSVAHYAAHAGHLPIAGFNRWDLKDREGKTVAHVAVETGVLPPDFHDWRLTDGEGATVAHAAARNGTLPQNFSCWDLRDARGCTVADAACKQANIELSGEGNTPKDGYAESETVDNEEAGAREHARATKLKNLADALGAMKSGITVSEDEPYAIFTMRIPGIEGIEKRVSENDEMEVLASTPAVALALTRTTATYMEEVATVMESVKPGFNITWDPSGLKALWTVGISPPSTDSDVKWAGMLDNARQSIGKFRDVGVAPAESAEFVFSDPGAICIRLGRIIGITDQGRALKDIVIDRDILRRIAMGQGTEQVNLERLRAAMPINARLTPQFQGESVFIA